MLTLPPSSTWSNSERNDASDELRVIFEGPATSLVIDRDGYRIGASAVCEMTLPGGPALHSIVHRQEGVTWIEAVDDARLIVNGRPRRRMALRDGDILELQGYEFFVRFRTSATMVDDTPHLEEDISLLSAEELCNRILDEHSMVEEFESKQKAGWANLMKAVADVREDEGRESISILQADDLPTPVGTTDDCERLLVQIRELSEIMNGKSQELVDCENELIAATSLLEEAQTRVTQQIEGLLEKLEAPAEDQTLRASA